MGTQLYAKFKRKTKQIRTLSCDSEMPQKNIIFNFYVRNNQFVQINAVIG